MQADFAQLDFPPAQFDLIVSSFVWEHVPLDAKDGLLHKIVGWLASGGRLVFLFDVASGSPLFRWMRSKPDLYRKSVIDRDGHVGLEPIGDAAARFERAGLRLETVRGLNRTIPHLPVLLWLEPYGRDHPGAAIAAAVARIVGRIGEVPVAYQFAIHAWDVTLGRLAPAGWSRLALVVARRA